MITKPIPTDVPAYYTYYLNLVTANDLQTALVNSCNATVNLFANITEGKATYAYAPNKWTVKQVLNHIIDCERMFQYRALRFMRLDATDLAGFDENKYATNDNTTAKTLAELIEEFKIVRVATMALYSNVTPTMLDFKGVANNNLLTARGLGWFTVGHTTHHCNVIKEKYIN